MQIIISLFMTFITLSAYADTIEHYINILDGIPKMEIKADPQAQAWARSARNVLTITNETVAETLLQANEVAEKQGKPLFCLAPSVQLTASKMGEIIVSAYRNISSQRSDKEQLTVSQIAWIGMVQTYPCQNKTAMLNGSSFTPPNFQHVRGH